MPKLSYLSKNSSSQNTPKPIIWLIKSYLYRLLAQLTYILSASSMHIIKNYSESKPTIVNPVSGSIKTDLITFVVTSFGFSGQYLLA